MSTRIQRANNKVNTAAVAIGYTPNKSLLSPMEGALSGLNLNTNLTVKELTATLNFRTGQIYADSIIANTITTTTSLTGIEQGTYLNNLTADNVTANTLSVNQYIYGESTKIVPGKKIQDTRTINFTFTYNNKAYLFCKETSFSTNHFVQVYDIFNVNDPTFLLSSYQIAPVASVVRYALNKNTNHLYYATGTNSVIAYNLASSALPVSSARVILSVGSDVERIYVRNNYLYLQLDDPYRLEIYNISNPSTMTFTGSCRLFGRNIFGVLDNFVLTNITTLTGGNYIESIGVIDTVLKHSPYRLNETRFNDVGNYSTNPKLYKNYIYRTHNDDVLSASKLYFYDVYDFLRNPFRPTLTHITSSTLPGYENIGNKSLTNGRLYIASTGQKGGYFNQYPKGFSVWNYSNIFQPVSSYFWNDFQSAAGPGQVFDNYQGTLLVEMPTLSSLQLFYTYSANFESLKVNQINSENFETHELNTENIEFINATGSTLSAINVVSNDVLPTLPVPRINLRGVTQNIWYGGNTTQQLSAGGVFKLERTPHLIQDDFTQEVISKHKIFLEILTFKKRKDNVPRDQYKGYTYTSPALNTQPPVWENFWTRTGYITGSLNPNVIRTNYIPITSVGKNINLSQMLHMRFREKVIAYRSLSSVNPLDYNRAPLLCPYHTLNKKKISINYPKYPYARAYAPLYVAFRYIAWLPEANNSKGQIISGPLSPRLRIANKLFPFYTNHYESSIKGYPVADISPLYLANFDGNRKYFTCNFC